MAGYNSIGYLLIPIKGSMWKNMSFDLSFFFSCFVCLSPFVCPGGTNISYTQERGAGQTFFTHRRDGGTNIFHTQGGANIFTLRVGTNILLG